MDESEILGTYEKVKSQISIDEFKRKVEEKMASMGGLCDEKRAAMLVATAMGADVDAYVKIKDIDASKRDIVFSGKVTDIVTRSFKRADGSAGKVANLVLGDETGYIRTVLWDDDYVSSVKVGDALKVRGDARSGSFGLEVSAKSVEVSEGAIETKKYKIKDIQPNTSFVDIAAKVLEVSDAKEFVRKDASPGKMGALTVGDETGRIRVVLWGEHAEKKFQAGSTVEITNAYVKERYGRVEIHLSSRGDIKESSEEVAYSEKINKIADIGMNETCSIVGNVSGIGSVREFVSKSGNPMKVGTIHLSDETGRIRVSLWGDKSDIIGKIDVGSKVKITDGFAKMGFNNEIEISADWRSKVELVE
jgi:replication factor A1